MTGVTTTFTIWKQRFLRSLSRDDGQGLRNLQVEDYPQGYPRFSRLVASHSAFYVCRRFSALRARLLLLKQDKLSSLEKQLEMVDQQETNPLFLASSRRDRNPERESILSNIDTALADYGRLISSRKLIFFVWIAEWWFRFIG